jgi:hypothetical protein
MSKTPHLLSSRYPPSLLLPVYISAVTGIPQPSPSSAGLHQFHPHSRFLPMARKDFVLEPCVPEDLEEMIDAMIPRDERRRWLRARFLSTMGRPENRNFKITEVSTGRIAAWARWYFPYKFNAAEKAEREREEQEKEKARAEGTLQEWPLGANVEACDVKFGELARLMKKHVDLEDMYGIEVFINPSGKTITDI